jgi:hypothetical protein
MFYCDHEKSYRVFNDEGKEFILHVEIYNGWLTLTMETYEISISPSGETEYRLFHELVGCFKKSRRLKSHKFVLDKYYEILPHFAELVREIELEEEEKELECERQEEYEQYRLAVYGY